MSLLDSKLVQIALVFLAFYVIMQIMNKDLSHENLDTAITPEGTGAPTVQVAPAPAATTGVSAPTMSVAAVPTGSPAPALQPTSLDGTASGGAQIVPAGTISTISSGGAPLPLSSTEETLMAAAPPTLPGESTASSSNVEAVDPDFLFGKRDALEPADLIPKVQDAELYAGLQPDPKLNQNFLQNRWSMGIDVSKPKRGFVNDLRGVPTPPVLAIVSPWNQSTQVPDLYRKSLGDIS
jgi:hypothetical protein